MPRISNSEGLSISNLSGLQTAKGKDADEQRKRLAGLWSAPRRGTDLRRFGSGLTAARNAPPETGSVHIRSVLMA